MKRLALINLLRIRQQIPVATANNAAPYRPEKLLQRIDSVNNMNSAMYPRHNDQPFLKCKTQIRTKKRICS
jgi:hypothetical protein